MQAEIITSPGNPDVLCLQDITQPQTGRGAQCS